MRASPCHRRRRPPPGSLPPEVARVQSLRLQQRRGRLVLLLILLPFVLLPYRLQRLQPERWVDRLGKAPKAAQEHDRDEAELRGRRQLRARKVGGVRLPRHGEAHGAVGRAELEDQRQEVCPHRVLVGAPQLSDERHKEQPQQRQGVLVHEAGQLVQDLPAVLLPPPHALRVVLLRRAGRRSHHRHNRAHRDPHADAKDKGRGRAQQRKVHRVEACGPRGHGLEEDRQDLPGRA
mmetsp:Transcript_26928/g.84543  ORF Transcript_26928/g.84543 Transcript_26928/m.84543 type:complete len:234 (+) Transcript_26928:3-704(+)